MTIWAGVTAQARDQGEENSRGIHFTHLHHRCHRPLVQQQDKRENNVTFHPLWFSSFRQSATHMDHYDKQSRQVITHYRLESNIGQHTVNVPSWRPCKTISCFIMLLFFAVSLGQYVQFYSVVIVMKESPF